MQGPHRHLAARSAWAARVVATGEVVADSGASAAASAEPAPKGWGAVEATTEAAVISAAGGAAAAIGAAVVTDAAGTTAEAGADGFLHSELERMTESEASAEGTIYLGWSLQVAMFHDM
mmetsp:Transcript_27478/g.53725  ORF Transcript_27478/g.53725 Transcript_27478/m.53725 type:complete len:119 (+) Transcript_27478:1596-1952(+)